MSIGLIALLDDIAAIAKVAAPLTIWPVRQQKRAVCTENLIRVDDVMESPKLVE